MRDKIKQALEDLDRFSEVEQLRLIPFLVWLLLRERWRDIQERWAFWMWEVWP